jgi:penicillin amidase
MRLVNNIYPDQLGELVKPWGDSREMWSVSLLLKSPDDPWWDSLSTKELKETRDDILERSFKEGYDAAVRDMGPDRTMWKWGTLHTATFASNPLGVSGIKPLEDLVNKGPYPVGGTTDTVNAERWLVKDGNFKINMIPSMRMIIDLSDLSRSVSINSTGQSGNPASPWYGDMIKSWLGIKYHPFLWTRQQVDAGTAHKMVLTP